MDFGPSTAESAIHIDGGGQNLGSGGELKGIVVDARPWQSYYLTVTATRNGVATNYNEVTTRIVWFSDPNGSIPIYSDVYEIFALRTVAPFLTRGGRLIGQDTLHGPYMQVIVNNIGADSVDVNYELLGTTRNLPGPYFREIDQGLPPNIYISDNFIVNPDDGGFIGVAAGSQTFIPGLMRYGRARYRITTNQNFNMEIFAGSVVTQFDGIGPLAAGIYTGELVVPKRSPLIRVTNNAGVAMNFFFNMISQNEKF